MDRPRGNKRGAPLRRPRSNSQRSNPQRSEPLRRSKTIRVSDDVARRIREGHPWVYQDALRGRVLSESQGTEIDIVDESGNFAGRSIYDPSGTVALRVFALQPRARLDDQHVIAACRGAARRRRQMLDLGHQSCCRVLSGDCEGLPSVNIDRYADYLVISAYSPLIERMLKSLVTGLIDAWSPTGIYLQRRFHPTGAGKALPGAELIYGRPAAEQIVVTEDRVRFLVDVTAPLGTGLFADMRLGRKAVAHLSGGRSVLNCFSYTGAFSLMAALNGASKVVSVDSAARAHVRARANFAENRLLPEDSRFEFITADTLAALERLKARRQQFGVIVLDPPSFSQAKGGSFTTMKDYSDLLAAALEVLEPDGYVCAASNTAKLSDVDFTRAIGRATSHAERPLITVKQVPQPADYPSCAGFPESHYLKFLVLQALT